MVPIRYTFTSIKELEVERKMPMPQSFLRQIFVRQPRLLGPNAQATPKQNQMKIRLNIFLHLKVLRILSNDF